MAGLKGIRLQDIYGFDDSSYNSFIDQNADIIRQRAIDNPQYSLEFLQQNAYINKLIRDEVGNEGYDANARNKSLEEKLSYYNSLFDLEQPSPLIPEETQSTNPLDTFSLYRTDDTEEQMTPDTIFNMFTGALLDSINNRIEEEDLAKALNLNFNTNLDSDPNWLSGDVVPSRTNAFGKHVGATLNYWFLRNTGEKGRIDTPLDFKELTARDLYDSLFKPASVEDTEAYLYSAGREKEVDDYAKIIRLKFDANPKFTYLFFNEFEDKLKNSIWKKYNIVANTNELPFTPNEMKDIMAKYYAKSQLQSQLDADKYVADEMQNKYASTQSFIEKQGITPFAMGANFVGNVISTVGGILYLPQGIINASSKGKDIEGAGWMQELLYYAFDNPISRYGNDIITTGSMNVKKQKTFKDAGYNLYEFRRSTGNESKFWNINTFFDILALSGFTAAGIASGTGISTILGAMDRQLLGAAARRLAMSNTAKVSRELANAVNTTGKALVAGGTSLSVAGAEASMDALLTYDDIMSNYDNYIELAVQKDLNLAIENGMFDAYYEYNRNPEYKALEEFYKSKAKEGQYKFIDPQVLGQIEAYLTAERAALFEEFKQQFISNPVYDMLEVVKQSALRAAARNMMDETLTVAFGELLFLNTLGKGVKAAKNEISRAVTGSRNSLIASRTADGLLRVQAKPISKAGIIFKGASKGAVESIWEGVEELEQNVDSRLQYDLADDYLTKYATNINDPEALKTLSMGYAENVDIINKSLKENILSKESIYSFLLGAVSAGMGSPTIISNAAPKIISNVADKLTGRQTQYTAGDILKSLWRNPFAENILDVKRDIERTTSEAADINKWLLDNPTVARMKDQNEIVAWMLSQRDAINKGDILSYKDSELGLKVATILMMDRLSGSIKEKAFSKKIKELTNINISDAEAENVILQAVLVRKAGDSTLKDYGELTDEEKVEILNDVKLEAKKLEELQKDVLSTRKFFETRFGNYVSSETLDAFTYLKVAFKDYLTRINSITDRAVDAYNSSTNKLNDTNAAQSTSAEKNAIARWGSLQNVQSEKAKLEDRLKLYNQHPIAVGLNHTTRTLKRNLKKQLEEARAAEKIFKSIEESEDKTRGLITASEILGLKPIERAYLLDPTRVKLYSREQQLEIATFKATENISNDILNDLLDAGRLLNKLNEFPLLLKELTSSENAARAFDRDVKLLAARRTMELVLLPAINAQSLKLFDDAFTEIINNPNYSEYERLVIPEILSRSKSKDYYRKYAENERTRRNALNVLYKSKRFNKLTNDLKSALLIAYERASRKHPDRTVLPSDIYDEFNSTEYQELLLKSGIKDDKLDLRDPIFDLAVVDILSESNKYTDARNAIEESKKQIKTNKKAQTNPTNPSLKKTFLLVNNRNKDKFNTIVDAIKDYLNGKIRTNIHLTKLTFIDLINLLSYGNNFVDVIDIELIPSDILNDEIILSKNEINKILDKIQKFTEDKKLELGSAVLDDKQVANLLTLQSKLSILATFDIKDALRNAIIEIDNSLKEVVTSKNSILKAIKNAAKKVLNKYLTKEYKNMNTAEQQYFDKYEFDKNIQEVKNIVGKRSASLRLMQLVLGYNQELVDGVLQQLTSDQVLDNDTLPLIMYVLLDLSEVTGTLKERIGVIKDDGVYYIPIGLLLDSRTDTITEGLNNLNSIRQSIIEGTDDILDLNGFVLNLKDKKKYILSAFMQADKQSTAAVQQALDFTSYMEAKYDGSIYDDKGNVKQEVIDDFKQNVVSVTTSKVKDDNGEYVDEEGNFTIRGTFTTKDGQEHEYFYKTNNSNWIDRDTFTQPAYLTYDDNGDVKPMLLNVSSFNPQQIIELFDDTDAFIEMLKVERSSESNAVKLVNAVRRILREGGLLQKLDSEGLKTVSVKINQILNQFLNLSKTVEQKSAPYKISLAIADNKLTMYLKDPNEDKLIPLSAIDVSKLPLTARPKLGNYNRNVVEFLMESIKNLILDGELLRLNDKGYPVVKPLINYLNLFNGKYIDNDIISALKYNMFTGITFPTSETKATRIEANEKLDNTVSASDPKIRALESVGKFIKDSTKPADPESYGAIAVTKFISDDSVEEEKTPQQEMALKFGTTVDILFRLFFDGIFITDNSKKEARNLNAVPTYEEFQKKYNTYKEANGLYTLTGLNEQRLEDYYKMFLLIYNFINSRGETVVTGEFRFISNIVSSTGKYAKLVAEPDLITIDERGYYHIYDLKTFKYTEHAVSVFKGFNTAEIAIKGLSNIGLHKEKWNLQLALYKLIIETAIPGAKVASIGIIPISVNYDNTGEITIERRNVEGNFDSIRKKTENGQKRTVHIDTDSNILGTNVKMTRSYNDAIMLDLNYDISKINVNSTNANWHSPSITEVKQLLDEKATGTIDEILPDQTVITFTTSIESASNKDVDNLLESLGQRLQINPLLTKDKNDCGTRRRPNRGSAF